MWTVGRKLSWFTVKMQWFYKLIKDNLDNEFKLGTIVVPKNTKLVTSTNATTLSEVKYCAQTVNTQHDELNKFRSNAPMCRIQRAASPCTSSAPFSLHDFIIPLPLVRVACK